LGKNIFSKKQKNTPIAVIKNEPKINRTFEKKYYDILHVEDVFQEDEKPIKQEILIGEENFYKEVTLTEETMNEAMTNLDDDSDVDFFGEIDDDDTDFPMDELLENAVPDYEEEVHLNPQYYNNDYLNIGGYDVVVDDIYVKRPIKKKTTKKKEGTGYMYQRLMSMEPLFMIQQLFENHITTTPQYMSMGNFVEQLNYYNDLQNIAANIETKIEIALGFYILFTNTFITESTNKYNIKKTIFKKQRNNIWY